jgi:leader peptidase (prepilin peptidase)/N-methyltransferase
MPSIYELPSPYLELCFAVLGLCVGSFLNVVAIRSLAEQSLLKPPSQCPKCNHRLGALDLIPLLSYFLLKGKCRYCQASIHWHYPLVEAITAIAFVVVVKFFEVVPCDYEIDRSVIALFMLVFVSTLIAVTVTDFREKLIPHDITYPMLLVGIGFSTYFRHDLLGTLAGIGVSYILFDFIAHYGLKFYYWLHPELLEDEEEKPEDVDDQLDHVYNISDEMMYEEPLEVMGGADAVLAAVIAAWLGWEKLAVAVVVAFLVGALMGAYYLFDELRRARLLGRILKPAAYGFIIMSALPLLAITGLVNYLQPEVSPFGNPSIYVMVFALGLAGATFGILSSGLRVTKTFPFGPALAIGAAYAISTITLTKDGGFIKPGA